MSNKYFTRGTVIRITSAKSDGAVYQLRRYDNAFSTVAVGEFSSHTEAEHAFFRQFPLGILAEGDRHGVQQMSTRGHAREYVKHFPEWQAKDAGKLAGTARWCVVKRAVNSPRPTLTVKKEA